MMKILILKEFLSHLRSFKFYPLTVTLVFLFIINGIWFSHQYQEYRTYFERNIENSKEMPLGRSYQITPDPGIFCCANNEKQVSSNCWIRLDAMSFWQDGEAKGNIYAPIMQELDWVFIVQILFSLLIILLSYNAISEEAESKTLTLVAANAISRWQIYLGKFISIFLITAAALLVSILTGLITILFINKIPVNGELLVRIFLFFISSLIYGALFIFIGLGCSILMRHSTTSLLIAISVWLFLVIILPESAGSIIKRSQTKPSEYELTLQYDELEDGIRKKSIILSEKINAKAFYTEKEKEELFEDTRKKFLEIVNENTDQKRQLADYILILNVNRYLAQQRWQSLSPAILFRQITETLMYGGDYRYIDFIQQLREFTFQFQEYYDKQNVEKDNWPGVWANVNGQEMWISPDYERPEYNHMEFELRPPSIGKSIGNALQKLVILLSALIGVGVWGFVKFVRCDIR